MWRLFDTKFNTQSGAGRRVKEIWFDAEILFGKSQERYLFRLAATRQIKEASADDTGAGRGPRKCDDEAVYEVRGCDGRTEEERYMTTCER